VCGPLRADSSSISLFRDSTTTRQGDVLHPPTRLGIHEKWGIGGKKGKEVSTRSLHAARVCFATGLCGESLDVLLEAAEKRSTLSGGPRGMDLGLSVEGPGHVQSHRPSDMHENPLGMEGWWAHYVREVIIRKRTAAE
jgi:hypothetical protein